MYSITSKQIEKYEKVLYTIPKGFNKNDKERIRIFGKRLRECRKTRYTQHDERLGPIPAECPRTQTELAKKLEVSTVAISQYELGEKLEAVPMQHLLKICFLYDVSLHYLLGYVDNPDYILDLDAEGDIQYDENGKQKELLVPITFQPSIKLKAIERYQYFLLENRELFDLIDKLMQTSPEKQKLGAELLKLLLNIKS